ncbi:ATP-binding protein [Paucibacter sp. APW11]|uniref:ATP-binding protein n=1 Tax=Roseateles aquae TaxID=3077235 RepID=A0ABU3PBL8_9BURK|nr:ATP-binding protein [Paucibacter sp. APW11]MDT8999954.1 ATP-binding protein [Paucibacter sp. APW11]
MQRQHGLVLVLGPSGSGKTSLVSAGLVPALRRAALDGRWRLVSDTQLDLADLGSDPAGEAAADQAPCAFTLGLAAALLDWETAAGEALLCGFNAHDLARALRDTPQTVLAELRAALQGEAGTAASEHGLVLLFVDRLEALFRSPLAEAQQREAALRLLQTLAESGLVLVVAACRNDYYPQLAEHAWLMRDKAQGGHLDLAPPSAAEIAQMVRLPARAAGLSFGVDPATHQRLDDLLCDAAAASPDALPLLQYTLEQLYQQRSPHGELSFAAYQVLGGGAGGLEGVIAEQAEQLIRGLTLVQQAALPHVLALLVLVGEDEASPVGGRRALWSELREPAERELVQALVDARLLVSERSSEAAQDEPGFRVAHEALLRRWPRVTEWIAEHRQHLQARARLRQQVQRWTQGARAAEFLWPRGRQLQDALALRQRGLLALSEPELAFLNSCERRAAWSGRLKGAAVAALAGLTLLAGGMAWRAQQAEGVARQRSAQADDLLGYLLGELADKLRPIGRLELLHSVAGKALTHLGAQPVDGFGSNAALLQRGKALNVISEVRFARGDLPGVREASEQALSLIGNSVPLKDAASEYERQMVLGAAAFWRGQADYSIGDFDAASKALRQYLTAAERMQALRPDAFESLTELSYALNSLGSTDLARGELMMAATAFQRSASLKRQAVQLKPSDLTVKADLADTLSWLVSTQERRGEFVDALRVGQQRIALEAEIQALAPNDLKWQHSMAIAHLMQGRLYKDLGRFAEAAVHLKRAVVLSTRLVESQPDQLSWQDTHFVSRLESLEIEPMTARQRLSELSMLEKSCREVFSKTMDRLHTVRLVAKIHLLRAQQFVSLGDHGAEKETLEALAAHLVQASAKMADLFEIGWPQALVRLRLAELLRTEGRIEESVALCRQAKASVPPQLLRQSVQWTQVFERSAECLDETELARGAANWLKEVATRQATKLRDFSVN